MALGISLLGGVINTLRIPPTIEIQRFVDIDADAEKIKKISDAHFQWENKSVLIQALSSNRSRVTLVFRLERRLVERILWAFFDLHTPTEASLDSDLTRLTELVKNDRN